MERAREQASPIEVLIADVQMPGVGGPALSRILVAERPELRVILTSGYGDDGVDEADAEAPLFLEKPFSPGQLDRAVRAALAGPPSGLVPGVPEA